METCTSNEAPKVKVSTMFWILAAINCIVGVIIWCVTPEVSTFQAICQGIVATIVGVLILLAKAYMWPIVVIGGIICYICGYETNMSRQLDNIINLLSAAQWFFVSGFISASIAKYCEHKGI